MRESKNMGKVTGYAFSINRDKSITIAPCNENVMANIQSERMAIRNMINYTLSYVKGREEELVNMERSWWKDMAEDLGRSLEGWSYDFTTMTLIPPKKDQQPRES